MILLTCNFILGVDRLQNIIVYEEKTYLDVDNFFALESESIINTLNPIRELEEMADILPGFKFEESKKYLDSFGQNIDDFYFNRYNPLAPFCYYKNFVLIDIPEYNEKVLKDLRIIEKIEFEQGRLNDCISRKDFKNFFFLIDERIAVEAYKKLFGLIPDEKKYSIFWYIYSRCLCRLDNFSEEFIRNILKYRIKALNIPGIDKNGHIKIYRGQLSGLNTINKAFSWSLDINTAIFFASRFDLEGQVYQARIHKDYVLAYINNKNEKEIVAFPRDIQKIEELKLISFEDLKSNLDWNRILELYNFYIPQIREEYFYRPKGIHGLLHTKRVLLLVIILAYLEQLDGRTTNILCKVALYHDIGRKNDNVDPYHGFESFQKLLKEKLINFDNGEDQEIIRFIIENHCINDKKAYQNIKEYNMQNKQETLRLFNIFKDADGLDRVRIRDLDIKHLRTDSARSLPLVARQLFKKTKEGKPGFS